MSPDVAKRTLDNIRRVNQAVDSKDRAALELAIWIMAREKWIAKLLNALEWDQSSLIEEVLFDMHEWEKKHPRPR